MSFIEIVNDFLKSLSQIEHTRHRSVNDFLVEVISVLLTYNLMSKNPLLNLEIIDEKALATVA